MQLLAVHRDLVRLPEAVARIVDVVDDGQRAAADVAERKTEVLREASDLVLEADVEADVVRLPVPVVVDPDRVRDARVEAVVVRPRARLLAGIDVHDQHDPVGLPGLVAAEHEEVADVRCGIERDQRRLPVAGRVRAVRRGAAGEQGGDRGHGAEHQREREAMSPDRHAVPPLWCGRALFAALAATVRAQDSRAAGRRAPSGRRTPGRARAPCAPTRARRPGSRRSARSRRGGRRRARRGCRAGASAPTRAAPRRSGRCGRAPTRARRRRESTAAPRGRRARGRRASPLRSGGRRRRRPTRHRCGRRSPSRIRSIARTVATCSRAARAVARAVVEVGEQADELRQRHGFGSAHGRSGSRCGGRRAPPRRARAARTRRRIRAGEPRRRGGAARRGRIPPARSASFASSTFAQAAGSRWPGCRVRRELHRLPRASEVADQLARVRDTRIRGDARPERDHPLEGAERLLVAAELDQRVADDAVAAARSRARGAARGGRGRARSGSRGG